MKRFVKLIPALAILLMALCAIAQKLPDVQKASLRAPANITIDGKATEWNNQFQAYNKAIDAYYSIANDDDKLYLIIQAKNKDVIHKMMRGGVTFTINSFGKKTAKNAAVITFPYYEVKDAPNISLNNKPQPLSDTAKFRMKTDSFMRLINKRLFKKEKYIAVSGLKEITDSLISVYNDNGIEAKVLFDNQLSYTYELAIPTKYLGLSIDKPVKFDYNIRFTGIFSYGTVIQMLPGNTRLLISDGVNPDVVLQAAPYNIILAYPTDFWGAYTLVRN